MQRIIVLTAVIAALAAPAHAQFVVIRSGEPRAGRVDCGSHAGANTTRSWRNTRRSSGCRGGWGTWTPYRIPPVSNAEHDVSRWEFGGPWLQGLNGGDPDGAAYRASHTPSGASRQHLAATAARCTAGG